MISDVTESELKMINFLIFVKPFPKTFFQPHVDDDDDWRQNSVARKARVVLVLVRGSERSKKFAAGRGTGDPGLSYALLLVHRIPFSVVVRAESEREVCVQIADAIEGPRARGTLHGLNFTQCILSA